VLELMIYDLPYSTKYRFAIRALSKQDRNIKGDESTFAHASNWFGHGNGRQWQEYFGIATLPRYATPKAIYVNQAEITETTMPVYLRKNVSQLDYLDLKTTEGKEAIYKDKRFYVVHFDFDALVEELDATVLAYGLA
jgi:hypothetical protein